LMRVSLATVPAWSRKGSRHRILSFRATQARPSSSPTCAASRSSSTSIPRTTHPAARARPAGSATRGPSSSGPAPRSSGSAPTGHFSRRRSDALEPLAEDEGRLTDRLAVDALLRQAEAGPDEPRVAPRLEPVLMALVGPCPAELQRRRLGPDAEDLGPVDPE